MMPITPWIDRSSRRTIASSWGGGPSGGDPVLCSMSYQTRNGLATQAAAPLPVRGMAKPRFVRQQFMAATSAKPLITAHTSPNRQPVRADWRWRGGGDAALDSAPFGVTSVFVETTQFMGQMV